MLKNKVFVIVVALVLVVSITFNIKVFVERDKNRQLLINHIYFEMENISRDLELFITDQKEGSVEKKLYRLEYASVKLRKLDQTILNYSIYVDELLFYPGIISFDLIADTLMYGYSSELNGATIYSVSNDDVVSDDEMTYIKMLQNDLKDTANKMTSANDALKENNKLSIQQINSILNEFYLKWSDSGDTSPYRLLRDN
ncbi:hypothetical protein [Kineothrix sedimenti]|uniref:DUF4230 domain-containing protein n=1 Tax=Kineothrix sedimenti TaxID=3123317 RepID=A0ABZ3EUK4_9FIRM